MTHSLSIEVSIIDFTLLSSQFGFLTLWEIPEKYLIIFDHKIIILRWEDNKYHSVNLKDK